MNTIRLGTRGSPLAIAQAGMVAAQLEAVTGNRCEQHIIATTGDIRSGEPLHAIGGKGVFIHELERALIDDRIDIAVHSAKDLPARLAADFTIAAVPEREVVHDVLVSSTGMNVPDLAAGARVGTGSLRRRALLLAQRPDLAIESIRGNVDTRLRKLAEGEVDALVLAAAALRRLAVDCSGQVVALDPDHFVPAPAQGALAIECLTARDDVRGKVAQIDDVASHHTVECERIFLAELGGSCVIPVGARALIEGEQLRLTGLLASPDGEAIIHEHDSGHVQDRDAIGRRLAQRIMTNGGAAILARLNDDEAK